ncbi:MAG: hypothetical protein JWR19_3552 [Pedosphaera sp.]|nr:hypothetical protein [Pedosphaera sp.]
MKTNRSNQPRLQGSILIVTLTFVVIAGILLGSYLLMVQTQTASVARSQTWNSIIPVTEAGIEDGIAMINGSTALLDPTGMGWANNPPGTDGWSGIINGICSVTRTVSGSSYYTAFVSTNGMTNGSGPQITAVGYVPFTTIPWVFSSAGQPFFFAAAGNTDTSTSTVARKVRIQTTLMPLFAIAVACRSNFNMNGKGCLVNSFNSSDTNNCTFVTNSWTGTNGVWIYNASKTKSGGDVGVNAAVTGSVSLGNGTINGHLHTGPGSFETQVQMGPQGTVGDTTFSASNSGIQGDKTASSWWAPDFNVTFPEVKTPTFTGQNLPPAVNGYITLSSGNYTTTSASLGNLLITGPVTLWVQGSASIGITIATTNNANASLILYVGKATGSGDTITLAGSNAINSPGYARNLQIYGLPSLTSIDMHGNAAINAAIYAPDADLVGGGGGSNTQDTQGSLVVKSVSLNGKWNFHYDESLKSNGATRGWVAKNWSEIKLTDN